MLELVADSGGNAFEYMTCAEGWVPFPPGATVGYNGMCGTGKPYMETVLLLDSFVYDHANDVYRFVCWLNQANWPSWKIKAYHFHPETATLIESVELTGFAVAHAWTDPMYNGGLNGLYAGYIVTPYKIVNVLLPDGIPTAAMISNPHVTADQIPDLVMSNMGFAICPERKLFVNTNLNSGIRVWDYSATPGLATLLYTRPLNESFVWGMGYENQDNCWMLMADQIAGYASTRQTLVKYNYGRDRMELVSELQQQGGADRFAQVAFDTKRKKLAAIRIKTDNPTTGQAVNSFEIYSPRPAMAHITVPVAVKPISEDTKTLFVSHLMGTKAEAGGQREVSISCAPTAALITTPKKLTEANGRVGFEVTPPDDGNTETITVEYDETKVTS